MEGTSCEMMDEAQRKLTDGPHAGSRWRHFKGRVYVVTGNIVMEDDLAHIVCYADEENGNKYGRKLADFLGDHPGHGVKRFEQIE